MMQRYITQCDSEHCFFNCNNISNTKPLSVFKWMFDIRYDARMIAK